MSTEVTIDKSVIENYLKARLDGQFELISVNQFGRRARPFLLVSINVTAKRQQMLLAAKKKVTTKNVEVSDVFDDLNLLKTFFSDVLRIKLEKTINTVIESEKTKVVFDIGECYKGWFYTESILEGFSPINYAFELDKGGFNHIPAPLVRWPTNESYLLLSEPINSKITGWHLAKTSLRDLFDSGGRATEAGASLVEESYRLGEMVGRLHACSESVLGSEPGNRESINACLALVEDDEPLELAPIQKSLDSILDLGMLIRTHNSLSLKSIVRSDMGWIIADFGEFVENLAFPAVDLITLRNSYVSVAKEAISEQHPDDQARCSALAQDWLEKNITAFVAGYFSNNEAAHMWPADKDEKDVLLSAFRLILRLKRG